jgi:hypothetical protein
MIGYLRAFVRILMGILREIGDENAYQRHLSSAGLIHSGAEWRRFSEQRLAAKFTRPKCC